MKIHISLKSILITFLIAFVPAVAARAQYPVSDVVAQTLISQGNLNFLQQMATELAKLDTEINNLQTIQSQGQQLLTLVGNPSQALSFAAGSMGLNPSTLTSSTLFQSAPSIASSADGTRSLANTSGGIFQAIATTTPNGQQIVRVPDAYKKFDAFEQELSNFQTILTQAQTQRQNLLSQLQTVMNSTTGTQAEQSEKIARINALAAQLHANDEVIRDANEQRQSQNEANAQDSEKQKQAEQDELNTEFQQAQPQADQQWSNGLSSILNQKP
jgi:hypothetical protein